MKLQNKTASLSFALGLSAALLAMPAQSAPGKGWDVFNSGQGDSIHATSGYMGTSTGGSAGKGFDVFRTGSGDPIPASGHGYVGTSTGGSAGKGWDVFNMGLGDKI